MTHKGRNFFRVRTLIYIDQIGIDYILLTIIQITNNNVRIEVLNKTAFNRFPISPRRFENDKTTGVDVKVTFELAFNSKSLATFERD